jgi:hypothetical protein
MDEWSNIGKASLPTVTLANGTQGVDIKLLAALTGVEEGTVQHYRRKHTVEQGIVISPEIRALGLQLAIKFIADQAARGNNTALKLLSSLLGLAI